jgi:hypothetical protein
VTFLVLNGAGLRILVHPNTGNGYRDYTIDSLWLGEPVKLRLDVSGGERWPERVAPSQRFQITRNRAAARRKQQ